MRISYQKVILVVLIALDAGVFSQWVMLNRQLDAHFRESVATKAEGFGIDSTMSFNDQARLLLIPMAGAVSLGIYSLLRASGNARSAMLKVSLAFSLVLFILIAFGNS
jgi:hypothetical protein